MATVFLKPTQMIPVLVIKFLIINISSKLNKSFNLFLVCGNASYTQNARIVGGNVAVQGL